MLDRMQDRIARSQPFEEAIFNMLRHDRSGLIRNVTRQGIEKRQDLADAFAAIQNADIEDRLARRLRFNPDGMAAIHGFVHVEVKATQRIEKEPYAHYMKYENNGEPVLLFYCPEYSKNEEVWRPVYVTRVKDLSFDDMAAHESQFAQPRPVIDNWVHPRLDRHGLRTSKGGFSGSGTPFAIISRNPKSSNAVYVCRAKRDGNRCLLSLDLLVGDGVARARGT